MLPRRIDKPWGYEEIWADTESYLGKLIVINAGHRLSKQFHKKKVETVYVLEGVLVNYDHKDEAKLYYPGDSLHIESGQIHRFGADKVEVRIIEVSTNHLGDVVRLEDDYGR